jgi:hypothetical protein
MAGDWIKMRTDLYRDPKVIVMANLLVQPDSHLSRHVNQFTQRDMSVTSNVTRCAVVGALVAVWGVARHQGHRDGDDLLIKGVTTTIIDDISDLPGFGDAMAEAGWAVDTANGLLFPKFFRENNVDPEDQKREQAALRKRRQREREQRDNERDTARDTARDKSVTVTHREEKRRGEKNRVSPPIGGDNAPAKTQPRFAKPTIEEIELLGTGISAQEFWDFYEANGWKVGQNAMKDWRAAARNWKRRQGQFATGSQPRKPQPTGQQQFADYTPSTQTQVPKDQQDEVAF